MKPLEYAAAALIASVVVVTGVATAQDDVPPTTPEGDAEAAQPQAQPTAQPVASQSTGTFDVEPGPIPVESAEMLGDAQRRIERMRGVLGTTTELLEEVRETDGDILRINCINEKLAAMKGFVKVSEQSYSSLRDAASRDDSAAESHHVSLINVSDVQVRELGEEAQICVGQVQVFVDDTVADRRVDPGLADVDPIVPDDDEFDDFFATEPLPELTPFQ